MWGGLCRGSASTEAPYSHVFETLEEEGNDGPQSIKRCHWAISRIRDPHGMESGPLDVGSLGWGQLLLLKCDAVHAK
jgi:hypothetical protein